mmetsp:Transcript_167989/g.534319  ORF Transcript_167989/g.534319 Transcript_167989/m.534319 type:complete len:95 (+) Transcript_167989:307-591(+)
MWRQGWGSNSPVLQSLEAVQSLNCVSTALYASHVKHAGTDVVGKGSYNWLQTQMRSLKIDNTMARIPYVKFKWLRLHSFLTGSSCKLKLVLIKV